MIFLEHLWSMIKEISPFLILGFFICGFLSVILTVDTIKKYLGKKSASSIFLASMFGVPLPLCSCGVIPVSAYLRKHGATKGATTSFLISTPQTGVDSIFITYGLLGPVLAIYRPIIALLSGFLGGALVHTLDRNKNEVHDIDCEDECCSDSNDGVLKKALSYGFVRLPVDIVNPLIIGLLLSSMISIFIPSNYFEIYGSGITGMIIMLFLGLPTYVCATASVPIAFALYTKGFSLGAVLVFLMSGPATNITTISVCWKILGKKSTFIYLGTIIGSSMLAGLFLDILYPDYQLDLSDYQVSHFLTSEIHLLAGIFLIAIMINALRVNNFSQSVIKNLSPESRILNVEGMTCSHCEESIKKTLLNIKGVHNVVANSKLGSVTYETVSDNERNIKKAILELGFTIKDD